MSTPSAPAEDDVLVPLPAPLKAPIFNVGDWDIDNEPLEITRLRTGESFLDGVKRIAERVGGINPVSLGCNSAFPGMRVAEDQVGVILKNGQVTLRPAGAYRTTVLNPWKMNGAVIPISRTAGVEFDPLQEAGKKNRRLQNLDLGQSYRQIYLQAQQVGVFEDQTETRLAAQGTYVYSSDAEMRGVIDLNSMTPVIVKRETEDTAAAVSSSSYRVDQHGRQAANRQAHGTSVMTIERSIPSGYTQSVAGITIARPEKGFVCMHKSGTNVISMTEGICMASGHEDFVRTAKDNDMGVSLEIEFGDLNHYAKSTPVLELKSKDNIDALCRAQIKWKQARPDIWVSMRGAFTDPFDMLEEKCGNMMRDWLLSVPHESALEEKAKGFTNVEYQWTSELGNAGRGYGVEVLGIEITTLRFPHIDKQDEQMALQQAETNLQIETSRQSAKKEHESSKLNQATHIREQEDRDRDAQAAETQQEVQRRMDKANAETIKKKAEMDTQVVEAEKKLELARQSKEYEVAIAQANAEAEAERVRATGAKDAAQLAAEGEIAVTQEKNKAQLDFLTQQAALLKDNPGLVELLKIQNDLLKAQALADAAKVNPNVVLMGGQEGLEARRMVNGHSPQVPNGAVITEGFPSATMSHRRGHFQEV